MCQERQKWVVLKFITGSPWAANNINTFGKWKTKARDVPLPMEFAQILHTWMTGQPLTDVTGAIQWPFQGQRLLPDDYLFPGRDQFGQRAWRCPVTERAYLKHIRAAADYLAKERAKCRVENKIHPFEDVDLAKLGTHSFKKTTVTTLKGCKFSSALVSCITGTRTRTLDTTYDRPSAKKQRHAMAEALGPVIPMIAKGKAATVCTGGVVANFFRL